MHRLSPEVFNFVAMRRTTQNQSVPEVQAQSNKGSHSIKPTKTGICPNNKNNNKNSNYNTNYNTSPIDWFESSSLTGFRFPVIGAGMGQGVPKK